MEVEKREQTWTKLKNQALSSLELEKISLGAVRSELEQISDALTQLSGMAKDYHPNQLDSQKDTSIDALRRNWTFLSNLEQAIRKTNEQKVTIKKKEVTILEQCVELESEVKKYETLESRAAEGRKKTEALKESKAADEMASAYWLRQKYE
jgi:flagellar export protein FliJ